MHAIHRAVKGFLGKTKAEFGKALTFLWKYNGFLTGGYQHRTARRAHAPDPSLWSGRPVLQNEEGCPFPLFFSRCMAAIRAIDVDNQPTTKSISRVTPPDAGGTRFMSLFHFLDHTIQVYNSIDPFLVAESKHYAVSKAKQTTIDELRSMLASDGLEQCLNNLQKQLKPAVALFDHFKGGATLPAEKVLGAFDNFVNDETVHPALVKEVNTLCFQISPSSHASVVCATRFRSTSQYPLKQIWPSSTL